MKYSKYWKCYIIYTVISYTLGYVLSLILDNMDILASISIIATLVILLFINVRRSRYIKEELSIQGKKQYKMIQRQYWIFFWFSSILMILTIIIIA